MSNNKDVEIRVLKSPSKEYRERDLLDESQVQKIIRNRVLPQSKAEYYRIDVKIKRKVDQTPQYLVAYMLRKDIYLVEMVKVDVDDNFNVKDIMFDYNSSEDKEAEDEESKSFITKDIGYDCGYDFIAATPVPEFPTAKDAVETLNNLAISVGLRSRTLLGPEATVENYKQYLTCGLKGFVNIGHGNTELIALDDGVLDWTWFNSVVNQALKPEVVYFNSCEVFNDPLKIAVMNAGARTFIGGIRPLLIGPSEEVCKCFWGNILISSINMDDALHQCEQAKYPETGAHGIAGDMGPFNVSQQPKLVLNSFGYDAGGWRVDMHPRFLSDLTGDGSADVVGFSNQGVEVALNNGNGTFQQPKKVLDAFGYNAGGWRVDMHPRFLADLTGDGSADVVGFSNQGVEVALNNGNGTFQQPKLVLNSFGYNAGGWRVDMHPRFLADLTGDGSADVVGFSNQGVEVALNNGNGTFQQPKLVLNSFGYNAGGWRVDMHPRFLADLTGDGSADVVGFSNQGVEVALNNGNGTFQQPKLVLNSFGYNAGGWRVDMHPRFLADLTGDGKADIVGFGDAGVWVALNNGNGTFQQPQKVLDAFGYNAGGWRVDMHPRFLADLTGDGRADIVGFSNQGVEIALNNGNGTFQQPQKVLDAFGYNAGGWRVNMHPRFLADLTGDGRADIVGFGSAGVWESTQ